MNNPNWTNVPPYVVDPLRLEYRWGTPHTRVELKRALEVLKKLGISSWWIGVMGDEGALFKSSIMPVHPELKDDVLPWLSEECSKSGITLITHYSFEGGGCYNFPILRQHPEWRMQFLRNEKEEEPSFDKWPNPCPNSPYMELLEEFMQEVIGKLGMKGVWFDSAPMAHRPWVGCSCPRCSELFHQKTGYTMPANINWESADFRAFIDWRYTETARIWQRMSAAVRKANPSAFIAINTYRRRPNFDWHTGSCLQPLDFPVLVGSEEDGRCQHALLQTKYLRAMCNMYPAEVWKGLVPWPLDWAWLPNPEPEGSHLQHGLICMTGGGFPSYGTGAHPALMYNTLKTLNKWLKPRAPWVGGEPIRYAGLVLSRHTQDFSQQGKADKAWDSAHGMHELLTHLHLPSEVLLDEHLELKYFSQYSLIVLPEVTCISDKAGKALEEYVYSGGRLLVTGTTGNLNLRGESRNKGALDKLLGISSKEPAEGPPVLVPGPKAGKDLPEMYAVFGEPCKIRASADAEVWAHFSWLPIPPEKEADWTERNKERDYDAIIIRHFGKGCTIYFAWDIGGGFLGAARKWTRVLFANVLADGPVSPYQIQAPPWLVVTAWLQPQERFIFHLLQGQGSPARFPEKQSYTVLEDIPPVRDVKISLPNQKVSKAWMPLSGLELPVSREKEMVTVTVPSIDRHEIVVFE